MKPIVFGGIICFIFIAGALGAEGGKPQMLKPPEVWKGYDPDAGEFKEEVLKRWTENGANYKEVYFSAYINGHEVRVYGIYAAPTDRGRPARTEDGKNQVGGRDGRGPVRSAGVPARNKDGKNQVGGRDGRGPLPAVMHLHGGGQTVNKRWLEAWTARGYAAFTCNYHGEWPNRKRFTIYPESLKQGNHKHSGSKRMATVPNVRTSSWYIWSAIARRALSYVCRQPEVDRERIGAFGVSMGGTTIWSFAMDSRLKAACAIYGCGWNRYYRNKPRFAPSKQLPEMTEDDKAWLAGMAPEAYPPFIKCPMLFLSGTNDHHGNMDRDYQTLARLPKAVERRQAFTPRFRHHIGAAFDQNLIRWMDTWLKDGPKWPNTPVATIELGKDGVPVAKVTADRPTEVETIAIYYAVRNPRPASRNWRDAKAERSGDGWKATLPILDTKDRLFVFANVHYKSGVHLSSNFETAIPAELGDAKATDKTSRLLYDGSDGTGMWVTKSQGTDPVPGQLRISFWAATGSDGRKGLSLNRHAVPITYQPGDPKWQAPKGASLRFKIATAKGETFKVIFLENCFWPGGKTYETSVSLKGQPGWQTVTLRPKDFHEQKHGGGKGPAPTSFTACDTLQLSGPWKDAKIVITDVQWVTE